MKRLSAAFRQRKLISTAATLAIIVSCLICVNAPNAMHSQDSDVVRINSWKKGKTRINEKVFTLTLASETPEYEFDFYSIPSPEKHFRTHFRRASLNTIRNSSLKCWAADLREVSKDVAGVNVLGPNLLSVEGPGVRDNFPREEWGAVFCPIDEPNRVLDGLIYPMRTKRNFYIEEFVIEFHVTGYQSDRNRNQFGNMQVKISLSNR
ncbi:MAG TPA: hypothetical protein VF290_01150 [Pyrinomonadaceae bacterium]